MLELACNDFASLIEKDEFIAITAITLGCTVAVVAIVSGAITSIVKTRSAENTRRELAAYVAEGTMQPNEAVAIMNSGRSKSEINELGA